VKRVDLIRHLAQQGGVLLREGARHSGVCESRDPLRLGRFHERTLVIEDALGRHNRRRY
jgi:hypothetical protein